MIRKLLILTLIPIYVLTLASCSTDSSSPDSDDEVSDDAAPSTDAAPKTTDEAADASTSEDLSGELGGTKEAANPPATSEQGLENELDGEPGVDDAPTDKSAEQELDANISQPGEPVVGNELPAEGAAIAPPAAEKVRITNIRYLSNQAGGTVVIEGTGPLVYHSHSEGTQFVIDVDNAQLPDKLKRPYPLHDFSGAFTNLQAEQSSPAQARIVVQMRSGRGGEPIVQTEGNSLLVVPTSAPIAAEAPPAEGQAPSTSASNESGPTATANSTTPLAAHTLEDFLLSNQRFFGKAISIQTKDADVRDVINFIAEESGANIVMSDTVTGRISVKVRKIPWDQALVSVMRSKKLGYVRQGNVLRIASIVELSDESDQALKMIETQRTLSPVKVRVIPVSYANVDDLVKQLKFFLSKEGNVVADHLSNTILVTDRGDTLEKVETIIKALDIAPNQVVIEGKIVEAQENFTSFIGVNWGAGGSPVTLSNGGSPGFQGSPIELTNTLTSAAIPGGTNPIFSGNISVGTLDFFGNLTASLQLAEQDAQVKIISSPRIATMNREPAEISQVGQQVTISTTINNVANEKTTQAVRNDMTLDLMVTPQITADNSVIMEVNVKRQFPGNLVDPQTQARPINTRVAKTKVLVRNGQTMVIGGIYDDDETTTDNGIPGLMDIPVIGWLFKSRAKDKEKNELLIFLTPRILQQQAVAQE